MHGELRRKGWSRNQRLGKQGRALGKAKAKVHQMPEKQGMQGEQGKGRGVTRVLVVVMEVMGLGGPIWKSSGASY